MPQTLRQQKGILENIDWVMILLWFLLVAVGWFNIYSSGNKDELTNIIDFSQRYGKQLIWIGAAMVIAFAILLIDPKAIPPFSFLVYTGVMVLLIAVVLFGKEVNNARSWFPVGGFNLQPAEFAKLAAALAISRYLSGLNFEMRSRRSMLTLGGILVLPMLLIMLQPDMGSAIVLLALVLPLYRFGLWPWYLFGALALAALFILDMLIAKTFLIGGMLLIALFFIYLFRSRRREMVLIAVVAASAILLVFAFDYAYHYGLKPHQKERIEVYMSNLKGVDKDIRNVGYNFYQSKVAIGSGGFVGKGYLKGTQTKMNFIPEQDTDFIFCTVGEEWGFLGSLFVITLYLLLLLRLIQRAEIQRSRYSQVYAYCVASILFFHFMINVGMTIGLAPVIGIPLPFMSYGGSSLWAFTILLFIFIKQDMHRYEVIG